MARRTTIKRLAMLAMSILSLLVLASISQAGTTTYTYDELDRIKTACFPDGRALTYVYDEIGNITSKTSGPSLPSQCPGVTPTYSMSGTVTSGGSALAGVTISLSGGATSQMTTDSYGFYGFSDLTSGISYTVTPSSGAYTFSPLSRTITISGADVAGQNFTGTALPPPPAPSGLTVSVISSGQLNLRWTDNATNETWFEIWRKTGVGGTYAVIDAVAPNTVAYSDTELTGDTTYYYKVRASNGGIPSGYSNEAYATTLCSTGPVRIAGSATDYPSLQAAYNVAANGNIIQSAAEILPQNLQVNRPISVTLQGGYDCGFTTNNGNVTVLKGMIQTFDNGGVLTLGNFDLVQ